jgi:hypothetical protein
MGQRQSLGSFAEVIFVVTLTLLAHLAHAADEAKCKFEPDSATGRLPAACYDENVLNICYISLHNDKEEPIAEDFVRRVQEGHNFPNRIQVFEVQHLGDSPNITLDRLIRSGVTCHGLVISGHHTSAWFGPRASDRLELDTLEQDACEPATKAFFEGIHSLWLQGCRTLGGEKTTQNNIVEFHSNRVAPLLYGDGDQRGNFMTLQSDFAEVFDHLDPYASRINRAFANATTFGWAGSAVDDKWHSENSFLYHVANLAALLKGGPKGRPISLGLKDPTGALDAASSEAYYQALVTLLRQDNTSCPGCGKSAWLLHGHAAPGSHAFGYNDLQVDALDPVPQSKDPNLQTAKRLDCAIRTATNYNDLRTAVVEAASGPVILDYTAKSLQGLLEQLRQRTNRRYEKITDFELGQLVAELRQNPNMKKFLYSALASAHLGLARKLEYYKLYVDVTAEHLPDVEKMIRESGFQIIGSDNKNIDYAARLNVWNGLNENNLLTKENLEAFLPTLKSSAGLAAAYSLGGEWFNQEQVLRLVLANQVWAQRVAPSEELVHQVENFYHGRESTEREGTRWVMNALLVNPTWLKTVPNYGLLQEIQNMDSWTAEQKLLFSVEIVRQRVADDNSTLWQHDIDSISRDVLGHFNSSMVLQLYRQLIQEPPSRGLTDFILALVIGSDKDVRKLNDWVQQMSKEEIHQLVALLIQPGSRAFRDYSPSVAKDLILLGAAPQTIVKLVVQQLQAEELSLEAHRQRNFFSNIRQVHYLLSEIAGPQTAVDLIDQVMDSKAASIRAHLDSSSGTARTDLVHEILGTFSDIQVAPVRSGSVALELEAIRSSAYYDDDQLNQALLAVNSPSLSAQQKGEILSDRLTRFLTAKGSREYRAQQAGELLTKISCKPSSPCENFADSATLLANEDRLLQLLSLDQRGTLRMRIRLFAHPSDPLATIADTFCNYPTEFANSDTAIAALLEESQDWSQIADQAVRIWQASSQTQLFTQSYYHEVLHRSDTHVFETIFAKLQPLLPRYPLLGLAALHSLKYQAMHSKHWQEAYELSLRDLNQTELEDITLKWLTDILGDDLPLSVLAMRSPTTYKSVIDLLVNRTPQVLPDQVAGLFHSANPILNSDPQFQRLGTVLQRALPVDAIMQTKSESFGDYPFWHTSHRQNKDEVYSGPLGFRARDLQAWNRYMAASDLSDQKRTDLVRYFFDHSSAWSDLPAASAAWELSQQVVKDNLSRTGATQDFSDLMLSAQALHLPLAQHYTALISDLQKQMQVSPTSKVQEIVHDALNSLLAGLGDLEIQPNQAAELWPVVELLVPSRHLGSQDLKMVYAALLPHVQELPQAAALINDVYENCLTRARVDTSGSDPCVPTFSDREADFVHALSDANLAILLRPRNKIDLDVQVPALLEGLARHPDQDLVNQLTQLVKEQPGKVYFLISQLSENSSLWNTLDDLIVHIDPSVNGFKYQAIKKARLLPRTYAHIRQDGFYIQREGGDPSDQGYGVGRVINSLWNSDLSLELRMAEISSLVSHFAGLPLNRGQLLNALDLRNPENVSDLMTLLRDRFPASHDHEDISSAIHIVANIDSSEAEKLKLLNSLLN